MGFYVTPLRLSRSAPHRRRRGSTLMVIAVAAVVVVLVAAAIWFFYIRSRGSASDEPIVEEVFRGPYVSVVLDQGEVESSDNVEVRCEVRSRNSAGISIIEVVPEGTAVKSGDFLVKLDSSSLEQERDQQQVIVNTSEARVIQAKATLEAAQVARDEYFLGTFMQDQQTIENEIFEAEENQRKAEQYARYSERLAAKNYVTALQLEGDRFAVERAKNALDLARNKLKVLQDQTKRKMTIQFDADIKAAEVAYENEQKSHKVEVDKLAEISDQIKKCVISVPVGPNGALVQGQVVFANKYSGRGGGAEFLVEEGATVREKQVIIRLPNPEKMQVKATINESRVTHVRPGMPVTVQLDALASKKLKGEVVKVNQYAEAGGWTSGGVKEYGTIIKIIDPPPEIRPGMNAAVSILVESRENALQIPLQAIYEYKGRTFCLVKKGDDYETRQIKIGSNNEEVAHIEEGLDDGDKVVMNPRKHEDRFILPDVPEAPPAEMIASNSAADGSQVSTAVADPAGSASPGGRPAGGPGGAGGSFTAASMKLRILEQYDTNGDGDLSSDELQNVTEERQRDMLSTADTNSDGTVDRAELTKATAEAFKMIQARMRESGGGGPPGGAQ